MKKKFKRSVVLAVAAALICMTAILACSCSDTSEEGRGDPQKRRDIPARTAPSDSADIPLGEVAVTGTASVTLPADGFTLYFTVESEASTSDEAVTANDNKYAAISETLGTHGALYTTGSSVYRTENGYTAARYLTFECSDPDYAAQAVENVSSAGATYVGGVNYTLSGSSSDYGALTAALEIAKDKAAVLGADTEPLRIEELSSYPMSDPSGNVTYTVTVRAIFAATVTRSPYVRYPVRSIFSSFLPFPGSMTAKPRKDWRCARFASELSS